MLPEHDYFEKADEWAARKPEGCLLLLLVVAVIFVSIVSFLLSSIFTVGWIFTQWESAQQKILNHVWLKILVTSVISTLGVWVFLIKHSWPRAVILLEVLFAAFLIWIVLGDPKATVTSLTVALGGSAFAIAAACQQLKQLRPSDQETAKESD